MNKPNRIESLDSIRGLAALSVVFLHCLLPIPFIWKMVTEGSISNLQSADPSTIATFLFTYSPLHIFWDGGAAVILFFVLSGFVLSLPFFSGRKLDYPSYAIRRICRIYIPYIVSLIVVFLCIVLFKTQITIPELSDNFNSLWQPPITIQTVIDHIFMIGGTAGPGANVLNGVIWTLVHELRISLILPFLVILISRLSWKTGLFVPLIIFVVARFLLLSPSTEFLTGLYNTVFFSAFFVLGIFVAKYKDDFKIIFQSLSIFKKILLVVLALLLYNWEWTLGFYSSLGSQRISRVISGFGSALIIGITLSSERIRLFFEKKPLIWLGKISFSLYLIHGAVLLTLMYSFHDKLPIWIIQISIPIISLIIAPLFYKYVEVPSIKLGSKLAKSIMKNKKVAQLKTR